MFLWPWSSLLRLYGIFSTSVWAHCLLFCHWAHWEEPDSVFFTASNVLSTLIRLPLSLLISRLNNPSASCCFSSHFFISLRQDTCICVAMWRTASGNWPRLEVILCLDYNPDEIYLSVWRTIMSMQADRKRMEEGMVFLHVIVCWLKVFVTVTVVTYEKIWRSKSKDLPRNYSNWDGILAGTALKWDDTEKLG